MPRTYTLAERGTICRATDYPGQVATAQNLLLPDADFDALRQWATRPTADLALDSVLTYGFFRGRERVVWRNYVGVLALATGTYLEIRPRAGQLVNLLRQLPDPAFRHLPDAPLGATALPLWEVFAGAFLHQTYLALATGPVRAYTVEQATLPLLRGKLRLADHLRQPFPRPDRLPVAYASHTPDIPANRVLKTALLHLAPRLGQVATQTRCRQLLLALAAVPMCANLPADLLATQLPGRLLRTYEPALRWATWLLTGQGPGLCAGNTPAPCLLFPMERLFEQYVAQGLRRAGVAVAVQETAAWLVDDHRGVPRFRLRPDLVLRQGHKTVVMDTKWKTLDARDPARNYGIDQADLYQLYAYGKKYAATDLVLIYPANEQFRHPLDLFGFDETLPLRVVPFDLDQPLNQEVARLLATVLGHS